jgi:hypothetical protein
MLGCSVTLPLIALFGSAPPEVADRPLTLPPAARSAEAAPPAAPFAAVARPPDGAVVAASYQSPEDRESLVLADDRLATLQRRLEQLGATYYRLESWGNEGPRFRFECRVAFERASPCTRHFEATDRDPMRAVAAVLRQVETWVAAQRAGKGT